MLKIRDGHSHLVVLLCSIAVCLAAKPSAAFDVFWTAGTSSWNTPANWDADGEAAVPDIEFEDIGIINNGGTATLNAPADFDAGGIALGQNEGDTGTLHLQSGGSLNLILGTGAALGVANVGLEGSGLLQVDGGATLSTTLLDVNFGSTVDIGGGAGSATVASTDGMWLAGRTITHGAGHTFTAATFVNFQGGTEYVVDLSSSTHTTLVAGGQISGLQEGPLVVQHSGGYTPTLGTTWTIFDGSAINGNIVVDTSETAMPAAGTGYVASVVEGGNGEQLQLKYQAIASLTVNTDTGALSVASESGAPVDVVGYSILSAGGQLNPANWSSLTDQSQPGWQEAGTPTANALSELNAQGSQTLNASPIDMGTSVYVSPAEFGTAPDVTFSYGVDGDLSSTAGIVNFTGSKAANNLLLTVDPTSGEGQLRNSSGFTIAVLGYTIVSDSGSLDDANWMSLESQLLPGWDEATANSNSLSELIPVDPIMTMSPGQALTLGDMFLVGSNRDLELSFAVSIGGADPVVMQGAVKYGDIELVVSVDGDYNNDGVVNLADYTVWRDNLGGSSLPNEGPGISPGVVDAADYTYWKSRFGATSGAGAGAWAAVSVPVPEPSSAVLGVIASLALATVCYRPEFCQASVVVRR